MIQRQIADIIEKDLRKKMVFLSGPRQCGKTTLAKSLMKSFTSSKYYNWDILDHRILIQEGKIDASADFIIFDEIHKYENWRNFLKGFYDEWGEKKSILVTGSARLDYYSRGGDSLQGRYLHYRLFPLTFGELSKVDPENLGKWWDLSKKIQDSSSKKIDDLVSKGPFPEPYFSLNEREVRQWRLSYSERLIREELRDLENVKLVNKIELLYERCPRFVGSVFSHNSVSQDLEISPNTAKKWMEILEAVYGIFHVRPFGPEKIKAVKKEPKIYLWDPSKVPEIGPKFENLVALHLLKFVFWQRDYEGIPCELRYFRTTVGHEVDFVVLKEGKPWFVVECKTKDRPVDSGLKYFLERIDVQHAFQVSLHGKDNYFSNKIGHCKIRMVTAERFLGHLP